MEKKNTDPILDGFDLQCEISKRDLIPEIIDRIKNALKEDPAIWEEYGYIESPEDMLHAARTFAVSLESWGLCWYMDGEDSYSVYLLSRIRKENPAFATALRKAGLTVPQLADQLDKKYHLDQKLIDAVYEAFPPERVLKLLAQNPSYGALAKEAVQTEKKMQQVRQSISDRIPEHFQDMFPEARKRKRHFILHIGPTNSGKTHDAMADFRSAKSGVYLAPLRLLAYEAYEESNRLGCPCSMVTGEEEILVGQAGHVASTIEMADFYTHYEVCVIDEGQMVGDKDRGGAWTAAVVGIQADVIHICSPECAKDILLLLIKLCGDTYEIREHHRAVPLVMETEDFKFPESVKPHDALIVFSKRSVIHAAAKLQKEGWKVSIIYGSLPYETRREEVGRFLRGETEVVVATDAIGMGMNLPVRRVVFLDTDKYDGSRIRPLTEQEVKQIAGRAGRQGMYEVGYCNTEKYRNKVIGDKLQAPSTKVRYAYLDFPETLLSVNGPISMLIEQWDRLPVQEDFKNRVAAEEIQLAKELEVYTEDKGLIYAFVTLPFDVRNDLLHGMWKKLFLLELQGMRLDSYGTEFLRGAGDLTGLDLNLLEEEYKKCDLLYNYLRKFRITEEKEDVLLLKKKIAGAISDLLAKQDLPPRKCSQCGKVLPWNFPYGMCDRCFKKRRNYDYW